MEFNGTTGPWGASFDYENERITIYADWGIQAHICYTPEYSCEDDFANANAKLIETAPDLLYACMEVVKGYEGDGMEQMGGRDEVFYKVCKDAVNKALGKVKP